MRFELIRPIALATAALPFAVVRPQQTSAQRFASCVNFGDLSAGSTYDVGHSFTSGGITITVEVSAWSNGDTTTSGFAEVDVGNHAGGSCLDVQLNNFNLRFALGSVET